MNDFLDGCHWNIMLDDFVGDVIRCIDDGTQYFVLESLQGGNVGVSEGTP